MLNGIVYGSFTAESTEEPNAQIVVKQGDDKQGHREKERVEAHTGKRETTHDAPQQEENDDDKPEGNTTLNLLRYTIAGNQRRQIDAQIGEHAGEVGGAHYRARHYGDQRILHTHGKQQAPGKVLGLGYGVVVVDASDRHK
jgi:hypothetical protein